MFFMSLYLMEKWKSAQPIGGPFVIIAGLASESLAPTILHLTWPQLTAVLTSGICLAKNIINVVQLWKASKILVGVDLAERARARFELEMGESKEE